MDFFPLRLFSWRLYLLFIDCIGVIHSVLDVETLKEPMEIEMLQIFRAQGKLNNDGIDVVIGQFQLFEHLH